MRLVETCVRPSDIDEQVEIGLDPGRVLRRRGNLEKKLRNIGKNDIACCDRADKVPNSGRFLRALK